MSRLQRIALRSVWVALRQVARPIDQRGQARLEPIQQRIGHQRFDLCRDQLDRQRQTIEPRTDRRDHSGVAEGQAEIGARGLRPLDKQLHRRCPLDRRQICARLRQGQRVKRIEALAVDTKRRTAC